MHLESTIADIIVRLRQSKFPNEQFHFSKAVDLACRSSTHTGDRTDKAGAEISARGLIRAFIQFPPGPNRGNELWQ
jgi:hypothetical protein